MKNMIHDGTKEKTWQITVERSSGSTDEYLIRAGSLIEAFTHFCESSFPFNMAGIRISEASA